ncbi:MAG: 1-(5-phosphoribosyl)-5-[(5-phosphoribosylamino)methylideneamino]imidazole-4-carboxamide isomerase [Acetobacteraceae bacterium]|nr:1-(5-phosphoribosyl)-5-[(5-phosphoribosylamino)methylideneamino]imidazole-4-carboxamide isomerase [Acetobacteraceae bacterium]
MRLTLYPAIDLKDGACVRLEQGVMDRATVYSSDPAAQARAWQQAGFEWLHVVDLNGAFSGRLVNSGAVTAILAAVSIPVQLGGGIRDMKTIAHWLDAGVCRVILGSAAVRDPRLLREACRLFPGLVCVGIDARAGMVATDGWSQTTRIAARDFARACEQAGAAALIYTDIARDGMLGGVNLEQTKSLAQQVSIPVIASGGVASLADLQALKRLSVPNIEGVIIGRALYDGRIVPAAALTLATE